MRHAMHRGPERTRSSLLAWCKRGSFRLWLEDILGLKTITGGDNEKLRGVMQLLIDIRKEAKSKKDFATSDRIRNQLQQLGILLKDEKDGSINWSIE